MKQVSHSYFVVMISYPARYADGIRVVPAGQQAIVDLELTRRDIVQGIRDGDYPRDRILFIHHVDGLYVEPVTDELIADAFETESV